MQLSYVSRNGRSSESCVNTEINNGLNLASYAGNYPVILSLLSLLGKVYWQCESPNVQVYERLK